MWAFIIVVSFLAIPVFLIIGIVSAIKKTAKFKKYLMFAGISFVVMIIAAIGSPNSGKALVSNSPDASAAVVKVANAPATTDDSKAQKDAEKQAKEEADAKTKEETDAKAKAEAEAKAKAEEEAKKPLKLSGKGDVATDPIPLKSGFLIVEGNHKGRSNFALQLMDGSGTKNLMVNTIGNYKGKTLALIRKNNDYLFNVTADGAWELNLSQFVPSDVSNAPTTLSGKGDDVVFVKLQKKLTKFTFKHSGESNFVVMLNGSNLLVNEIGKYEGSTAQSIKDAATYAFSVQADGEWSIQIN